MQDKVSFALLQQKSLQRASVKTGFEPGCTEQGNKFLFLLKKKFYFFKYLIYISSYSGYNLNEEEFDKLGRIFWKD